MKKPEDEKGRPTRGGIKEDFIVHYDEVLKETLNLIQEDAELHARLIERATKVEAATKAAAAHLSSEDFSNGRMHSLARLIGLFQVYWAEDDPDLSIILMQAMDEQPMVFPQQVEGYVRSLEPMELHGMPLFGLFLTSQEDSPYIPLDPRMWAGYVGDDGRVRPFGGWDACVMPYSEQKTRFEVTLMVGDDPPYLQAWNPDILRVPDRKKPS